MSKKIRFGDIQQQALSCLFDWLSDPDAYNEELYGYQVKLSVLALEESRAKARIQLPLFKKGF